MSSASKLRTDWVCIATEGQTVDERQIKREWLTDMAESYDPEFYSASMWPDHQRYYAMGDVLALKAEEVDGKMKLFAQLSPTRDLIYYNQAGQYKFCSIEPVEDFAGDGKTYLFGLGVTDTPASTGTTRLQFSSKQIPAVTCASEPLTLGPLTDQQRSEKGLFAALKNFLSTHGEPTPQQPETEDTDEMKLEQFNELKGLIAGIADKQTALEEKVDKFAAAPGAAPAATVPVTEPTETTATGVTNEQFSELLAAVKSIGEKQGGLEDKFSALLQEKPNQEPPHNPAGKTVPLV